MSSLSDSPVVKVLIEIPKGSRNKYEYDPETGRIMLDRMLFSSVHYPSDYGFILDSLGEDGDALDALVLLWEPTFPGCVVEARPVGVFRMWDEKGQDDKILCVPLKDPQWNHITQLSEVPPHLQKEIEHFFTVYKDLEEKKTGVDGWYDAADAQAVISQAFARAQ
jgi:inorganic pyrophosphatase